MRARAMMRVRALDWVRGTVELNNYFCGSPGIFFLSELEMQIRYTSEFEVGTLVGCE
jgi:hypothetical protein